MKATVALLLVMLALCAVSVGMIYKHYTPTTTKTSWNGGRRYTIESYVDPVLGVQKRVIGVEGPEREGMMDPNSLITITAESDKISRLQWASFSSK